jgi:hypothetical protein
MHTPRAHTHTVNIHAHKHNSRPTPVGTSSLSFLGGGGNKKAVSPNRAPFTFVVSSPAKDNLNVPFVFNPTPTLKTTTAQPELKEARERIAALRGELKDLRTRFADTEEAKVTAETALYEEQMSAAQAEAAADAGR